MQQLSPRKKTVISFHPLLLVSLETPSVFSFQVAQEYEDGPSGLYPGLLILRKTDECVSYFNHENHVFADRRLDH